MPLASLPNAFFMALSVMPMNSAILFSPRAKLFIDLRNKFWSDVPASSSFMPRLAAAAAQPSVSSLASPNSLAAAPARLAISRICASVLAPLLPRSTSVAAKLS